LNFEEDRAQFQYGFPKMKKTKLKL